MFGAKILVTYPAWQDLTYGYLIKDGLVVRFRQCSGTEGEVGVYVPDPLMYGIMVYLPTFTIDFKPKVGINIPYIECLGYTTWTPQTPPPEN